jgi:hypothetical protein
VYGSTRKARRGDGRESDRARKRWVGMVKDAVESKRRATEANKQKRRMKYMGGRSYGTASTHRHRRAHARTAFAHRPDVESYYVTPAQASFRHIHDGTSYVLDEHILGERPRPSVCIVVLGEGHCREKHT